MIKAALWHKGKRRFINIPHKSAPDKIFDKGHHWVLTKEWVMYGDRKMATYRREDTQ